MRDELHLMELVDRYLDGGMGEAEQAAFEQRVFANAELHDLVDAQRALREGLHRAHLRTVAASAHRTWLLKRWLPWAAAGLIIIAAAGWFYTHQPVREYETDPTPLEVQVEPTGDASAEADTILVSDLAEAQVETVFIRSAVHDRLQVEGTPKSGRIVSWEIHEESGDTSGTRVQEEQDVKEVFTLATTEGLTYKLDSVPVKTPEPVEDADRTRVRPLLATVELPVNADHQPRFPGGMEEMQQFIADNVRQPRGTKKKGVVTIGFTVNKKGEVVNVEVVRSLGRAFDAEALRVIGLMPAWTPCMVGERPVKSRVEVPVHFSGKPAPRRENAAN